MPERMSDDPPEGTNRCCPEDSREMQWTSIEQYEPPERGLVVAPSKSQLAQWDKRHVRRPRNSTVVRATVVIGWSVGRSVLYGACE